MKEVHIRTSTLDAARAREIAGMTGSVELEIHELDCSAARELTKFRGEELAFLNDFPQMDECAAKELLQLDPNVFRIQNLFAWSHAKAIEDNTLLALAKYVEGILNLQGFPSLNQESAQALSEFRGYQLLVYQKVLDVETARCLSSAESDLLSVSLEQMDEGVARALSRSRARDDLQIVVKSGIDASVASELAQYQGGCLWITWEGRDQLDEETARALASVAGALRLDIEEIDQEMAKALATHTGDLDLASLEYLDVETAQELGKAQCSRLILDGLSSPDAVVAAELAKYGSEERQWASIAMPEKPEEFIKHALAVLSGKRFPGPQLVHPERGVAHILRNPKNLCLNGVVNLNAAVARILAHAAADILELGQLNRRSKRIWKAAQAEKEQ